jgi:transposase
MPRPYPPEFRARAVALVRAGKPISRVAAELGISEGGLHNWVRQDQIDRGERPGRTTPESTELAKARKRIRQLETEVEILKRAAKLLGEDRPDPKGSTR